VPVTGRSTPLLCGRRPRGKSRTAHLPMVPFLKADLSGQNGSTRFPSRRPTTDRHGFNTVTNFPWSPITEVADFVLLTAARETAFRSGAMTSRIAQLTVVDCLFVTLAQQDLPGTRTALERTFAAAQAKRVRRTRRQQPGDQ